MKASLILLGWWLVHAAAAESQLTGWTADAGALVQSAGTVLLHSSIAQGQPDRVLYATNLVLYQGFLGGAVLFPHLDTDHDGQSDEVDIDNDGDALPDLAELSGEAFTPVTETAVNTADSDGDGATDHEESILWTNPWDPESGLRILDVRRNRENVVLVWQARAGKSYELKWTSNLQQGPPTNGARDVIVAQAGGLAPWYQVQSTATVAIAEGDFELLTIGKARE